MLRGVKIATALPSPFTIVIVSWNTRDLLLSCLRSLGDFGPHQIIVVDNASSDGTAEAVTADFPAVHLILPGKNLGYAEGNNLGFGVAKHPFILALNPDTEVSVAQIEHAVEILDAHAKVGCLAARLIDPPPVGLTQRSVRGFPTVAGLFGAWTGLDRLFPKSFVGSYFLRSFDYSLEQFAPQPMGTFLLFRKTALEEVAKGLPLAPFDTQFPIFFNDVDLSKRLDDAGWKTLYSPEIVVVHHGGASTRQVKPMMVWESHRSLIRYLAKHKSPVVATLLAPLILLGALLRARGFSKGFRK
jgi:N-acetylglucosaminyl-diphospho-decaprenol L-rhamnosyltransferase